jgi:RES domain-containing protein
MRTVWRIVQPRHAVNAFSGEGARLNRGRWNSVGTAMVYTAESKALASLEYLVHVDAVGLLDDYVFIPVHFDKKCLKVLDFKHLPFDWQKTPFPVSTQRIGDLWVSQNLSPVLEVPSVPIPGEKNYLINPNHPDFGHLQIGAPEPFEFDLRLLKNAYS